MIKEGPSEERVEQTRSPESSPERRSPFLTGDIVRIKSLEEIPREVQEKFLPWQRETISHHANQQWPVFRVYLDLHEVSVGEEGRDIARLPFQVIEKVGGPQFPEDAAGFKEELLRLADELSPTVKERLEIALEIRDLHGKVMELEEKLRGLGESDGFRRRKLLRENMPLQGVKPIEAMSIGDAWEAKMLRLLNIDPKDRKNEDARSALYLNGDL